MGRGAAAAPPAPTENLLLFTEQFNNAVWVKSGVTVTANTALDPLGAATADRLAFLLSGSITQTSAVLGSSGSATQSGTATSTYSRFSVTASIDGNPYTGSVYLKTIAGSVSLSLVLDTDGTNVRFSISDAAAAAPFTVVAWGAQLETGSMATAYVMRTT